MPVHEKSGQHLRQLIHRCCREVAVGAERPGEELAEDHGPVVVNYRIPLVHGHGAAPMRALGLVKAARGLVNSRLPGHLLEVAPSAAKRTTQPVGIFVQILEGDGLRTDVAAAQGVVVITADLRDPSVRSLDDDPAHRLAEMAGAMVHLRRSPNQLIEAKRPAPGLKQPSAKTEADRSRPSRPASR